MRKTIIAFGVLFVLWLAFIVACIFGLNDAVDSTCDWCFDNAGKWYTSAIVE